MQQLHNLLDLADDDETADGVAIDRQILQHDSSRNKQLYTEINNLRFSNRDLSNFGALAHGPFGSVDMVRCRLDNKLYVRKSVEKRIVARNASQCYPFHERDLLLAATKTQCAWTPHLLCTFQTSANLCYVMQFAEGGSLGDLLESSGQISESDVKWWLPQMITAIHWCHSQGFCHRDVKPSNFVVTATGRLLIIDFASSARLLQPDQNGVQLIPKEACLVLCGTCDYISPEILAIQEEAMIALDEEEEIFVPRGEGGYGRETDWWSLGATIYELIYGVAPFFAKDIRGTYNLIMNHERHLRFPPRTDVSSSCVSFLSGLLRTATDRLGRRNISEITSHRFLADVPWAHLHKRPRPPNLQLPQFEYNLPEHSIVDPSLDDETYSKGYAFSAFFNSSVSSTSTNPNANATNLTFIRPPSPLQATEKDVADDVNVPSHLTQYVGFTWGPTIDAFDGPLQPPRNPPVPAQVEIATPRPVSKSRAEAFQSAMRRLETIGSTSSAPPALLTTGPSPSDRVSVHMHAMSTPVRPSSYGEGLFVPPSTIRRTVGGSARKVGSVRGMSELEQLKQLSDCVRASARKRLNEHAGRTPGPAAGGQRGAARSNGTSKGSGPPSSGLRRRDSWVRMTLDFEDVPAPTQHFPGLRDPGEHDEGGLRIFVKNRTNRSANHSRRSSYALELGASEPAEEDLDGNESTGGILFGSLGRKSGVAFKPHPQTIPSPSFSYGPGEGGSNHQIEDEPATTDDDMPSPSPSPRPGSAHSRSRSGSGLALAKEQRQPLTLTHRSSLGPTASVPASKPTPFHRTTSSLASAPTLTPSLLVLPQRRHASGEDEPRVAKERELPVIANPGESMAVAIPPDSSSTPYPSAKKDKPRIFSPPVETTANPVARKNSGASKGKRDDLDMDATPRPRKVPSSVPTQLSLPKTSIFDRQSQTAKQARVSNAASPLQESTAPRPIFSRQEEAPHVQVSVVPLDEKNSRIAGMEMRLQKMMRDIEGAERKLLQVKSSLN